MLGNSIFKGEALNSGRGRGIRTPDILLPKQARYQTALYPDVYLNYLKTAGDSNSLLSIQLACG